VDELKTYMDSVKTLVAMYVPPKADLLQAAEGRGDVATAPNPSNGTMNLIVSNYIEKGDKVTFTINQASHQVTHVAVDTWLNDPSAAVTLDVAFTTLPNGVSFASTKTLTATAKEVVVTITDADFALAGGAESMSRSPYALPAARWGQKMGDAGAVDMMTGALSCPFGTGHMGVTAENVAAEFGIDRAAQDRMALASQRKAVAAQQSGFFDAEIVPVIIPQKKGDPVIVDRDEHPRETSLEALARLKPIVKPDGTVTAGNASGVNDGACALLLASESAAAKHGLKPRARVLGMATAGVAPRIMGFGPAPAVRKVLELTGLALSQMDVIELNEAFAAQGLAVLRDLGVADDDARVNPNGGAIALGHPLGASGARLATTALNQLETIGGRYGLCTMCIGVGQGIALVIERV